MIFNQRILLLKGNDPIKIGQIRDFLQNKAPYTVHSTNNAGFRQLSFV